MWRGIGRRDFSVTPDGAAMDGEEAIEPSPPGHEFEDVDFAAHSILIVLGSIAATDRLKFFPAVRKNPKGRPDTGARRLGHFDPGLKIAVCLRELVVDGEGPGGKILGPAFTTCPVDIDGIPMLDLDSA